jgi:hypothetical protein
MFSGRSGASSNAAPMVVFVLLDGGGGGDEGRSGGDEVVVEIHVLGEKSGGTEDAPQNSTSPTYRLEPSLVPFINIDMLNTITRPC